MWMCERALHTYWPGHLLATWFVVAFFLANFTPVSYLAPTSHEELSLFLGLASVLLQIEFPLTSQIEPGRERGGVEVEVEVSSKQPLVAIIVALHLWPTSGPSKCQLLAISFEYVE